MSTGYFGIPGRYGGKVHLVDDERKPVCGLRLHPKAEYQWCSHGIAERMIECERCKAIARRMIEETHRKRIAAMEGR